ncbi:MAG TPA: HupE/UreJ family protein [Gemmatimonadales bacterium]|nr:HupE/UreJ family protein [Gemmatimonadales bacterium]
MSELTTYFRLGVGHILDARAIDHLLFLVALAAGYRLAEWRDAVWVVTAFTVGHSITLALAATDALVLPTDAIEFLIPLTIVATCVENLAAGHRHPLGPGRLYRPVLAAVFGLVHGAGFANYLRGLFLDSLTVPLLGFNLGIEAGQLAVLVASALALAVLDRLASHRMRVTAISTVVLVLAARMAVERHPWQP